MLTIDTEMAEFDRFKCKKIFQRGDRRVANRKLTPAMSRNFVAIPDGLAGWLAAELIDAWRLGLGMSAGK